MDALSKILAEMERQLQVKPAAPPAPVVEARRRRKKRQDEQAPAPPPATLPAQPMALPPTPTEPDYYNNAAPQAETGRWSRSRIADALALMQALGPPPGLSDWEEEDAH